MKLEELRGTLDKHSNSQLKTIIAELYKNIPKSLKEGMAVDSLISDPDASIKKVKESKEPEDIGVLKNEIESFLLNRGRRPFWTL